MSFRHKFFKKIKDIEGIDSEFKWKICKKEKGIAIVNFWWDVELRLSIDETYKIQEEIDRRNIEMEEMRKNTKPTDQKALNNAKRHISSLAMTLLALDGHIGSSRHWER